MVCYKKFYYKYQLYINSAILAFIALGNKIYPTYFNDTMINKYKNKGKEYYKYLFILNVGEMFIKKYNIDILLIGNKIYNNLITNDDNLSDMSDMSDMSDLDDFMTQS